MRDLNISILLLLISVALSSCAPVYVPNARQTNLMEKQGEFHGAAHAGTNGGDIQLAYAMFDHVGIFGSTSFKTDEETGDTDQDYHKHRYGEFGAIYFHPIGNIGRFEALGGFGLGRAEAVDQYDVFGPNEVRAEGSYHKAFAQTNIGLETSAFETGVALRLAQITFSEFETSSMSLGEAESGTFFEPAAFARLGWKNVKIESQLGVATLLQDEVAFDYESLFFSIGLHFQIDS
ncbi:hypothetical protein [Fodinibius sp. AD559]|uniref:hypothetical protein n=1 Tax=Fodinibius sp. AD559 TaxID=3424179 RepID=UPI004046F13C